jgi:Fis family transcriptional regulator
MVARGVHYEDARREFDKKFLSSVIDKSDGNLCKAADTLGVHRNTLARKIRELKIKARPSGSS